MQPVPPVSGYGAAGGWRSTTPTAPPTLTPTSTSAPNETNAARQPRLVSASLSPDAVQGNAATVTVQATLFDPAHLVRAARLQRLEGGDGRAVDIANLRPESAEGRTVHFAGPVALDGLEPGRLNLQLAFDLAQIAPRAAMMRLPSVQPLPPAPLFLNISAGEPLRPSQPPSSGQLPPPYTPPPNTPPRALEQRNDLGVRIAIPEGWAPDESLRDLHGPIDINTFGNHYLHGGVIPPGGAAIDITRVARPAKLDAYIGRQLEDASGGGRSTMIVAGAPGVAVHFSDRFVPDLTYRNAAVFVPVGDRLCKFLLSYHAGDPRGSQYERDSATVLASARLGS